ncbi:MAG: hypothetical protein Q8N54_01135 [Sulfurimicrobium sp.]|nr:hypothetical protein [Sulfurimicrobium sp.]MDP1704801.1 hypothetical protein [Sulfurimicrobium sp.]MDP2198061.1 hypothetical protein [Sulfurimicrobium sp.]MDP2961329.1 hypothetical protein [Sulfurimicrobium sp.]MDP3688083.1 hypothetical protein [Sulfurimicrobium sp.]
MKYKVLSTVQMDGQKYAPGEFIEVSGTMADDLLKGGSIEQVVKPFSGYKPVTDAIGKGE